MIDIEQGRRCVVARGRGVVYLDDKFSDYFNVSDETFKNAHVSDLINISTLKLSNPIHDWWDLPAGHYALTLKNESSKSKQIIPCRIDHIESSNKQYFVMISVTSEAKGALLHNTDGFAKAIGKLSGFMEAMGIFRKNHSPKEEFDTDGNSNLPSKRLIEDFRQFFNLSVDILIMADKNGRISKVNPSFRRLLGYTNEEVQDKLFYDLLHPEDRNKNKSFARKNIKLSHIPFQESRIICKDKSIRWLEWKVRTLGNMTYIVATDITSHKIYQSELAMKESQLRDAQKMARMGYWKWIIGEKNVHFSSHLYEIFDIDKEKFTPSILNISKMVTPRNQKRMQRFMNQMLESNGAINFDFRMRLNKTDERYVRCYGRCELDANSQPIALYGLLQDVTQEKQNRKDLLQAKREAEASLKAKSRFLANMSHELRTPLNAIIGFSEVMKSELLGPVGSSQYTDYISGIHESGQHLLDIISSILDMSKIEAGRYEIEKENVNIVKAIRLASHMMQINADEAEISIDIAVPNELPPIFADRRCITQILTNLLSNAIKFTNAGGWITIKASVENNTATIQIQDTGIGIPANMLSRVTKPFEQVAGALTRGHGGTGLGLAITKSLVELHGGTLSLKSEEGEGTTVTVTLPVVHPENTNDN